MSKSIHGNCPSCGVSLDGSNIYEDFLAKYGDEKEATRAAAMYAGWGQHGLDNCWGRAIALYDQKKDMTTAYQCPDCQHTWSRF